MYKVFFEMDDGTKMLVAIQPTLSDAERIVNIQLNPSRYRIEEV